MKNPIRLSDVEANVAKAHFQKYRDVPVWLINRVEYQMMPYTYSMYIGFALKALYEATGDAELCDETLSGINRVANSTMSRDEIMQWCRDTLNIELEMDKVIKKGDS